MDFRLYKSVSFLILRVFVDFTPSDKGTFGQIIRFLHDPDELKVIADSFEEFLDMLVENGMKFICGDDF